MAKTKKNTEPAETKPGAKPEVVPARRLKKAASEVRNLAVALTEAEHVERGQELAKANVALVDIQDEQKTANEGFRKRIKEAKKEMERLSRIVGEGREYRDVTVLLIESADGLGMDVVKADTRELVERRPFTPEERQRKLFKDADKAADKAIAKGVKAADEAAKKKADPVTTAGGEEPEANPASDEPEAPAEE